MRVPCVLGMKVYPPRMSRSRLAVLLRKYGSKSIELKSSLQSLDHQLRLTHMSISNRHCQLTSRAYLLNLTLDTILKIRPPSLSVWQPGTSRCALCTSMVRPASAEFSSTESPLCINLFFSFRCQGKGRVRIRSPSLLAISRRLKGLCKLQNMEPSCCSAVSHLAVAAILLAVPRLWSER